MNGSVAADATAPSAPLPDLLASVPATPDVEAGVLLVGVVVVVVPAGVVVGVGVVSVLGVVVVAVVSVGGVACPVGGVVPGCSVVVGGGCSAVAQAADVPPKPPRIGPWPCVLATLCNVPGAVPRSRSTWNQQFGTATVSV